VVDFVLGLLFIKFSFDDSCKGISPYLYYSLQTTPNSESLSINRNQKQYHFNLIFIANIVGTDRLERRTHINFYP
jgi:hypothetical protein